MSDESKEKRQHEEHHPHHANPHKHDHHKSSEDATTIHPAWLLVLGAILIIIIVLSWTMNYGF